MPKSPSVLVAVGRSKKGHIPQQSYEDIVTEYNLGTVPCSDASFYNRIAKSKVTMEDTSNFCIYGFMPGYCRYTYDSSIEKIVNLFQKNDKVEFVISDYIEKNHMFDVRKYIHPGDIGNVPFFVRDSVINKINFLEEDLLFKTQIAKLQQEHILFHIAEPLISFVQEGSA